MKFDMHIGYDEFTIPKDLCHLRIPYGHRKRQYTPTYCVGSRNLLGQDADSVSLHNIQSKENPDVCENT